MLANGARALAGAGLDPVVTRVTLHDGVYRQLSQALMAGRFDPGQTLTISSLSEHFVTSHMPVREALRRLAAENALEVASTGSAHVPRVTRARLDDLSNVRTVVEGAAAEFATQLMDAADVSRLQQAMSEHREAIQQKDLPTILAKNQEFHFALYRGSKSLVLMQLIETLWLQFGPYLRMLTKYMEPRLEAEGVASYVHHIDIMKAVKKGDGATVRKHTVQDIRTTQKLLQTLCPADPEVSLPLEKVARSTRKPRSSVKIARAR